MASQNMSSNSSDTSGETAVCKVNAQKLFYMEFNQMSLIPAAIIIIVLLFMRKRAKFKQDCLDGRPGIQVPVDFLGEEDSRFSYVAAYGGMAIAVTNMFFGGQGEMVFVVSGHPFIKVFQNIVTVLCIGTIYLPFFMCLNTDAKLVGAVFGFLYTVGRTVGLVTMTLLCPIVPTSTFIYWPLFYDFPALLSHLVLLVRYVVIFVNEARDKCCKKKFLCRDLLGEERDFYVGHHYVNHVKTLLQGVPKNEDRKWYVKGRNFVYEPQPHFKFSVAILSTVFVSGIIIYEILVASGGTLVGLLVIFKKSFVENKLYYMFMYGVETYRNIITLFDIAIASLLVSLIFSALYTFFQMYRMMVSHRNHVIKLIKGDRRFLPNKLSVPHVMVGMSLRFAGYQVAYFLWGFLMMAGVLLLLTLLISSAILFLPTLLGDDLGKMAGQYAFVLLPTVAMALFIFLLQQGLARYVFKDRSINSKVVNIHNRRLFLLVSFFFFFFNILVGLFSCLLRILKGMILGVMFIGRVDRPLIMKGFTNLDGAYCAYIGFLHLQVAHKHPVVRVFSHMLWSGMRRKQQQRLRSAVVDVGGVDSDALTNRWTELKEVKSSRPRVSASALNKWFTAYTMINNPVLIHNRKGFLKHILMGIPNSPSPSASPLPSKQDELQITSPSLNSLDEIPATEAKPSGKALEESNTRSDHREIKDNNTVVV